MEITLIILLSYLIGSIPFGDYLDALPAPAVSAVFRSGQFDDVGLIAVDSTLIGCVVDALLSGRRGSAPSPAS